MTSSRGNILFLILLAVVLFAALAYAVTSSMRGGGRDASSEKVETVAAQIVQEATMIQQTVARLRLVNDCKDSQISFYAPSQTVYQNNNAPSSNKCHVFDPAGGGAVIPTAPKGALGAQYSAQPRYNEYVFVSKFMHTAAGSNFKLAIVLPYVSDAVCREINFKLYGLAKTFAPFEDNNTDVQMLTTLFTGSYFGGGDIDGNGSGTSEAVQGYWRLKDSGCSRTNDTKTPFYFHALIDR